MAKKTKQDPTVVMTPKKKDFSFKRFSLKNKIPFIISSIISLIIIFGIIFLFINFMIIHDFRFYQHFVREWYEQGKNIEVENGEGDIKIKGEYLNVDYTLKEFTKISLYKVQVGFFFLAFFIYLIVQLSVVTSYKKTIEEQIAKMTNLEKKNLFVKLKEDLEE